MSSLSGLSTSGLNFGGLSTGIDSSKIIDGLTKLNQQRIDTLKARQQQVLDRQSAYVGLQTRMADLQLQTSKLARSAGGAFDGRTVATTDDKVLTATAGTAASAGTYSVTVGSLAQAHQTASAGFADPNAKLKTGTLTLQAGSGTAVTVTVDSRNNTLQGLADSINAAGGDVRAAVINDGSANPYRLLLTSTKTGTAGAITVTNNLTGGTGATIDPAATTVQAAADAQVTLGSGAGAITVRSSTNQVNTLIPGVSLNLKTASPTTPIILSVTNDTKGATDAVQGFVDSFNAVVDYIHDQTKYDPDTKTAGLLIGERDVISLQNDLTSVITSVVPGLASGGNRLSAVGITLGSDGKLAVDDGKLAQAVSGSGTALADLKKLFGVTGTSDNAAVQFGIATAKTKPTGVTAYQVQITSPATRAAVTAGSPLPGTVVISPPNNTLMLRLNGLTSTGITLSPGSYTPDQLATLLQQSINTNAGLSGNTAVVGVGGDGKLTITSQQFGSGSNVSFAGGTALSALGFTGSETSTGSNVVGNFVVDGQVEAAAGSGQALTGNAGNANTDGLLVRATGSDPTTAAVTVTQGLAGKLNSALGKFLDTAGGKLKVINDGFTKQYDELNAQITKQNTMMDEKKAELTLRFADMEAAVSKLKGLGASLTSLIPKASF